MRTFAIIAACLILATGLAHGQSTDPIEVGNDAGAAEVTESADETDGWSFSATANAYFVPDDDDYVQPTITADRDWLHLEARYNYEEIDAASAWVGYNSSFGNDDGLTLDLTPMLGAVFGGLHGVAPGYELTLGYQRFELYSEAEYVIDLHDSSDSFFYTWSEITYSPLDWLRFGVVIQRTRAYDTDFDIQRGLLLGVSYRRLDFATYVLNPDDDPVFVLSVGASF